MPDILRMAGSGKSSQQIADWLAAEHGINVTRQAINRHLRSTAKERGEALKAAVREKIAPIITDDLEALAELRKRLYSYETQAAEAKNIDVAIRAAEAQRKCVETTLRFSGAGEPDAPSAVVGVVVLPPEEADGD